MTKLIIEERKQYTHYSPRIRDYIALMKPRVMSLVVFTTLAGMLIAPGSIHPFTACVAILCTALGAGSAGCFNMWYDRDIDAIMVRTRTRPIVSGIIEESEALAFAIIMSVISIVGMAVCVNLVSAAILLCSILTYLFIYTIWLKRISVQNIVIGGSAGAFPPMIGWAAVTGDVTFDSLILFLIIFLWTPPHFWALALYKSDDYKLANIPMMPVVRGARHTKHLIAAYTVATCLSTLLPYYTHLLGEFYLTFSLGLNGYFLYLVLKLNIEKKIEYAPKIFRYSIIYLFSIFLVMIIDSCYF